LAEEEKSEEERGLQAELHAASLPIWRSRVEPRPLKGGLTNTNFVVEDAGRKFVVRIGGDIQVHGVVRKSEVAASRAAYHAGIAPEVIYAEPGALVLAYVDGRTLTAEDVRNPNNINRIARLVQRCHREVPKHLRGPAILFWVFHALRDYAHTLGEAPGAHPALPGLMEHAAELERAIGPVELVFGHNDLLAANFIDDGKRLWLVDWEYAGFNSPLFDLGGLASNSEMRAEHREALLESYFGGPVTGELRRRFTAMTAASLLRETVWSMVSEIHSTLDIDYPAYTAENLARFEAAWAEFAAMRS
jgi:thiamine kinase-like enzyme